MDQQPVPFTPPTPIPPQTSRIKKGALIGTLIVLVLLGGYAFASTKLNLWPYASETNIAGPGEHCGGNIANPLQCGSGYHCAADPNSGVPFGDVGGICTSDGDSISDWKTYTDEEYGFSFQYPEYLVASVSHEPLMDSGYASVNSIILGTPREISEIRNLNGAGYRFFFNLSGVSSPNNPIQQTCSGDGFGTTTKIKSDGIEMMQCTNHPDDPGTMEALFFHGNTSFVIESHQYTADNTALLNQILSTFKFTIVGANRDLKTYTSTLYGYQFNYPATGFNIMYPPVPAGQTWDMFDCAAEMGICALANQQYRDLFKGSEFTGAGFTVKILDKDPENLTTEIACKTRQQNTPYAHTLKTAVQIHGTTFFVESFGSAAAGTQVQSTIYRTFRAGKCWELGTNLTTSGLGANDAITALTEVQKETILGALDSMLDSFTFTK